ncbi:antibiotic biosynthesis monooxygenase [bacterium]|nr:antibiotic biosynthesis monooxygenase [bacterium]
MKRFLSLLFFIGMISCRPTETISEEVIEVAVTRVKTENVGQMPELMKEIREQLRRYDGFISMQSLRTDDTSRVFVDILRWRSKEHAQKAFDDFHKTDSCTRLMNAIESDIYFGHLKNY